MDPYSFSKLDPDLHSPKKLDPDPHKVDADPKHYLKDSSTKECTNIILQHFVAISCMDQGFFNSRILILQVGETGFRSSPPSPPPPSLKNVPVAFNPRFLNSGLTGYPVSDKNSIRCMPTHFNTKSNPNNVPIYFSTSIRQLKVVYLQGSGILATLLHQRDVKLEEHGTAAKPGRDLLRLTIWPGGPKEIPK
jgi:hypothetical protein